jgi:Capsule assembly protein Wzi
MKIHFTLLLSFIAYNLFAQQEIGETKREIKYSLEAGAYSSAYGNTPFWLRANQYGIVPLESNFVTLRGDIHSDYKKATSKEADYKLSKFDWGYGLNVVGNLGKQSDLFIPEAYIKAKYGKFEIYAGRRKEIVGLVDSTLSSGSYIWSGNALPMPKIQISTPNFVPLGFTQGFLSFKGNYAHGWFENSRTDVKNFYLHQKSLYFRLGKPDWKFKFYGGFNHQVQWGGELLYPDPNNTFSIKGQVGSSFNDYLNVVTGRSLADKVDSTVSSIDAGNRGGNHLGTIDFLLKFKMKSSELMIYRQNIYEDGSLFYLNNISDGLNGLSITFCRPLKKINIRKITIEYLSTYSQGGTSGGGEQSNSRLRGYDEYLNHGQYIDGWSYFGFGIGTPFVTNTYTDKIPKATLMFNNNKINLLFLGLILNVNSQTELNFKFSYSNNWGASFHNIKDPYYMFSSNVHMDKVFSKHNNIHLIVDISNDYSDLFKESLGIRFGVMKIW